MRRQTGSSSPIRSDVCMSASTSCNLLASIIKLLCHNGTFRLFILSDHQHRAKTKDREHTVQQTNIFNPSAPTLLTSTTTPSSLFFTRSFLSSSISHPKTRIYAATSSLNLAAFSPIPPEKTIPSILLLFLGLLWEVERRWVSLVV